MAEDQETAGFYLGHQSVSRLRASCTIGGHVKIYTKTGDSGETGLLGGGRVAKDHLVIEVCGGLDETNSFIGLARSFAPGRPVDQMLAAIQIDLFVLGSQVAACTRKSDRAADLDQQRIMWLEESIDRVDSTLPPMDAFILPGGHPAGAQLHVARAVCRRTERQLVSLISRNISKADLQQVLIYLNRLGDLLFVVARATNQSHNIEEVKWLPRNDGKN